MSRVKGGTVTRRRHKRIIKLGEGQFGSRNRLWRRANEAMMKSLAYAYPDRRVRKREFDTASSKLYFSSCADLPTR